MDFTSLPEKFKVGSDASPSHSELSFPSSPPSWVWGVPRGEADPSRTVSPSLEQAMGAPCGGSVRVLQQSPVASGLGGRRARGAGEGEGPSESQSANTSGASSVGRLDTGHAEGVASMGLTHGAGGSGWGPPRYFACLPPRSAALDAAPPAPGRPRLEACWGPGPAAVVSACSGAQGPHGHCRHPREMAEPKSRAGKCVILGSGTLPASCTTVPTPRTGRTWPGS